MASYQIRSTIAALSLLALLFSACESGSQGESAKAKAPDESPSFAIGVSQSDKGTFLTIRKDALEKPFLMQSEMSIQRDYGEHQSNPTSYNLKSRAVTFRQDGERLVMLESSEGMHPGKELPANAVLASFPIKEAAADALSFDFNEGMKNFIMAWDWYVSDYYGNVVKPDLVFPIQDSYLRSTKTAPASATIIQNMSVSNRKELVPVEVTYYFTLYSKNPNYKPVESPGFDYLGFFEANPTTEEVFGDAFTHISRWDISKPITYYISSSTPEKYRNAVREGILYWNKAFGKEAVKAEMAPAGITAPSFDHNIIQWHTDHGAGFAYADAQMDPLTGEILHAQIFIPSVFAEWPRAYGLPRYERKLKDDKEEGSQDDAGKDDPFIMAREMQETRLCQLKLSDLARDIYIRREQLRALAPERTDALVADYLRHVISHEVGHTLGLRHNFAASLVSEWTGDEEEAIFRRYMKEGKLPPDTSPPINSVMEYSRMPVAIISSALTNRDGGEPLAYDRYAIQWAYFGSDKKPAHEGHPFCTDSAADRFYDCERMDAGKHLVERRSFDAVQNLKRIPWLLSEAYLDAKGNLSPRRRSPVNKALVSARMLAASVIEPWWRLLSLLSGDDIRLRSIYIEHPDLNDADEAKIEALSLAWLNSEVEFGGGIRNVMRLIDPVTFENTLKGFGDEFKRIVGSKDFRTAPLAEGGSVEFGDEEIDYILKRSAEIFREVRDQLASGVTFELQGGIFNPIDEIETAEEIEARWAGYIITSGTDLDFQYSLDTRRAAAELLKSKGPFPDWLDSYIPGIAEELRLHLEAGFGMPIDKVDISKFPRDQRERIAAELDIYYSLASPQAPAPKQKPEPEPID